MGSKLSKTSEPSKPGKFVPYFNREVSVGQRGNVAQQVSFNTNYLNKDANIEYIVPTMDQLNLGFWIGTWPRADTQRIGVVGFCYDHRFLDRSPQISETALLIDGHIAQIHNKHAQTLEFRVKTLQAFKYIEHFKWHLILRKPQGNIDMDILLAEFKDYSYGYFTDLEQKEVNQESFCVEVVKKIFKTDDKQTTSLIQEAIQQSYNWRKKKQS